MGGWISVKIFRLAALASTLAALACATPASPSPSQTPQKTNLLVILADDLGWNDTQLHGAAPFPPTPNLLRLARRGMTFTRALSDSPLCSPTRSALLTGLSPARTGITAPNGHLPEAAFAASLAPKSPPFRKTLDCRSATRLDPRHRTLASSLRDAGYATGHFGKWHLGPAPTSPLQHGFDIDVPGHPGPGPAGSYIAPWKFKSFKERAPGEHLEDRMADEAVAFLERHRDRPFFLNYWAFSVHAPFDAKKDRIEHYRGLADPASPRRNPLYAAMVESLDQAVGRLLDALDRLGLADRTAVLFTSDNGGNTYSRVLDLPPTGNHPLRGGKGTVWDGGVRVPFVVAWPGVTAPAVKSEARVQVQDVYPTVLDLLGLAPAPGQRFDGRSFAPALRGEAHDRGPSFVFFPHSPGVPDTLPPAASVHDGPWKLIRLFHDGADRTHRHLLFDLTRDPGEREDLAAAKPDVVKDLDGKIERFLADAKAVVPVPNPDYAPAAKAPAPKPR